MMPKEWKRNAILCTDCYKLCHYDQYAPGTNLVYETWTPRSNKYAIPGNTHVVFFGLQGACAEMHYFFKNCFFNVPEDEALENYKETVIAIYSKNNPTFVEKHNYERIRKLHHLGYLPIKIKALPEGTMVPVGVPMFTVENTLPEFFWLSGHIESYLSTLIWQQITTATTADTYYRILNKYAQLTGDPNKVFYQAGDFSMRGMGSPESAYRCTAGHLTRFGVSSTVEGRGYLMAYYNASGDVLIYTPSTEHSAMCSYSQKEELESWIHLLTDVYPDGNVTIVSDSYDFWNVVDVILPALKDLIMNRNGKVAIRPDSGDPFKILCGDPKSNHPSAKKGLIRRLYEIFGGTINSKGYIELDPHIGAVYGDSITPELAIRICEGNMKNGFASTNVILGIGSYTYQYVTRDTYGFALKATAIERHYVFIPIQKLVKTDESGTKVSHKGLVAVVFEDGDYKVIDHLDPAGLAALEDRNHLKDFFVDDNLIYMNDFEDIRTRVATESDRVYGGVYNL